MATLQEGRDVGGVGEGAAVSHHEIRELSNVVRMHGSYSVPPSRPKIDASMMVADGSRDNPYSKLMRCEANGVSVRAARLRRKTVVVVGLGGVGATVAECLVRCGVERRPPTLVAVVPLGDRGPLCEQLAQLRRVAPMARPPGLLHGPCLSFPRKEKHDDEGVRLTTSGRDLRRWGDMTIAAPPEV